MIYRLKYKFKDNIFNFWLFLIVPIILIYNSCIQLCIFNENSIIDIIKTLVLSIIIVISSIIGFEFYGEKDMSILCCLFVFVFLIYAFIILTLIILLIKLII
jgi:hypothetical protein